MAVTDSPPTDLGTLLRLRPFRRYLLGQTLSGFGDSLIPIALVFAVLDQGGDATAVGLVLLASRLPAILFVLLGGVVGDRFDRRRILLWADAARCAVQAITGALLLAGAAPLWALAALQALSGTASAMFGPAATGLVRALVPTTLARGNALLGLSRNVVAVGGLATAGLLVSTVGAGWAFTVDAATFAASAAFLARLPALPPVAATESAVRAALSGVRAVLGRRWLWTSILYVAALNLLAVGPFLVLGRSSPMPRSAAHLPGPRSRSATPRAASAAACWRCGGTPGTGCAPRSRSRWRWARSWSCSGSRRPFRCWSWRR